MPSTLSNQQPTTKMSVMLSTLNQAELKAIVGIRQSAVYQKKERLAAAEKDLRIMEEYLSEAKLKFKTAQDDYKNACESLEAVASSLSDPAPTPTQKVSVAVPQKKKVARNHMLLPKFLAAGEVFTLKTNGLEWVVTWNGKSFEANGKIYATPAAVCRAHANTIHDAHPVATKPGSGYEFLVRASDKKKLGQVYDEWFEHYITIDGVNYVIDRETNGLWDMADNGGDAIWVGYYQPENEEEPIRFTEFPCDD